MLENKQQILLIKVLHHIVKTDDSLVLNVIFYINIKKHGKIVCHAKCLKCKNISENFTLELDQLL